ncbi:MAG: hydroxyacid dehydrogenase [Planctomycetota bacterium]|jgi:phosphoglycerate dehydrogenase-like enzyme
MVKILVAFPEDEWDLPFDSRLREELNSLGEVKWADFWEKEKTPEEYRALIAAEKPEVLVTFWGSGKLTPEILKENPQLKYMCNIGGTVRKQVERECLEMGLVVTNWGNVISRTISEASLMMILASLRRVTETVLGMHVRREWPKQKCRSLYERTVGLHGMGPIAQDLVPLLRPFGVRLSAYSPNCPDEVFERLGVERAGDLKMLYATNDVISIHTGNTPENFHVVNAEILGAMQDGAVLVNTARGAIVDTEALVAELRKGRIFAAIDVYEEEPLPEDSPLRGLENCLLIPHQGGPTSDRMVDTGRLCIDNIRRYLAGEEPVNRLTAARYDSMT